MAVKIKMKKKPILVLLIICIAGFYLSAQTNKPAATTTKKTTTTTVKKAPVTTSTTKTVVKPTTTTTKPAVSAPVASPPAASPPPAKVVKEPAGPPVTGAIDSGPKSYETDKKTTTTTTTKAPTKSTSKTVVSKTDVKKKGSNDVVRSYIGIRGGYNLSSLDGLEEEIGAGADIKNLPGYMGGLVINLGLSKALSIQPEVLYSQQGVQIGEGDNFIKGKVNVVNVPLLIKVAFGSPKIKFFINAGPYIGYKLSQSSELSIGGTVTKESKEFITEYDVIDGTKDNRFDFGAIGGAGLQFNLGGPLLVLEGRYQYGMADPQLYKDGKPASVGKTYGHNRVMTGTLGILFPLGGR